MHDDRHDDEHADQQDESQPLEVVREPWSRPGEGPSMKQRTGAHHAVRRVLDALAPERPPTRRNDAQERAETVRRYRSPRGCILQGNAHAVTVSWFPGDSSDARFGELQVISWAGVVSRPGATQRATGGARVLAEYRLRPVESTRTQWAWREADGDELTEGAVIARCLGDLDRESASTAMPLGAPRPSLLVAHAGVTTAP